jgi:hypothetical protein
MTVNSFWMSGSGENGDFVRSWSVRQSPDPDLGRFDSRQIGTISVLFILVKLFGNLRF